MNPIEVTQPRWDFCMYISLSVAVPGICAYSQPRESTCNFLVGIAR